MDTDSLPRSKIIKEDVAFKNSMKALCSPSSSSFNLHGNSSVQEMILDKRRSLMSNLSGNEKLETTSSSIHSKGSLTSLHSILSMLSLKGEPSTPYSCILFNSLRQDAQFFESLVIKKSTSPVVAVVARDKRIANRSTPEVRPRSLMEIFPDSGSAGNPAEEGGYFDQKKAVSTLTTLMKKEEGDTQVFTKSADSVLESPNLVQSASQEQVVGQRERKKSGFLNMFKKKKAEEK
jgi:hypothetical protein